MIIYFTSTGNSLTVARGLAAELSESVLHVKEATKLQKTDDKRIGLVFPAHYEDMPRLMKEFVSTFDFGADPYIFGILTHGGDPGNSLFTLKTMLAERGLALAYANDLMMPVNSRIMYGMVTTDIEELVAKQYELVDRFADEIAAGVTNTAGLKKKYGAAMMHKITTTPWAQKFFTPTINSDSCTQCGICASVCPVNNIQRTDDGFFVDDHCETCLTCMHWCPATAISFGKRKVHAKQRYQHPEVKLTDMTTPLK